MSVIRLNSTYELIQCRFHAGPYATDEDDSKEKKERNLTFQIRVTTAD